MFHGRLLGLRSRHVHRPWSVLVLFWLERQQLHNPAVSWRLWNRQVHGTGDVPVPDRLEWKQLPDSHMFPSLYEWRIMQRPQHVSLPAGLDWFHL